jgi:hypothetical protein
MTLDDYLTCVFARVRWAEDPVKGFGDPPV